MSTAWAITAAGLAVATLVSEDLTCIAAAQLIRTGQQHPFVAIAACSGGIYLGDLGLYFAGRWLGRGGRHFGWLRRILLRGTDLAARLDRHAWTIIVASRVAPGTRLPLYLAAGATGVHFARFAWWTLIAVLLWTPLFVMVVAVLGEAFVRSFGWLIGVGWLSLIGAVLAIAFLTKVVRYACSARGRMRLAVMIARIWRWEFWPSWLFYAPVAVWIAFLSVRHRGFATAMAANPGIPHGGFVGESKSMILSRLPQTHVLPFVLLDHQSVDDRIAALQNAIASDGRLAFPVILKPDVGQRGAGVRLVHTWAAAAGYLRRSIVPVIAQAYHPGPYEAGVFYYRIPGEKWGRIYAITDKRFPIVTGDGVSTLEELVWRHPRYRMQAERFLARHRQAAGNVLPSGKQFQLAIAGNHCQGAMFLDGAHLITPQLERVIDNIAQQFEGFYFGRFDMRYVDVEEFKAGMGFQIIELNGVTSEATNLYDPSHSLLHAYRILMRQWSLAYRIGDANRRQGSATSRITELFHDLRAYWRGPKAEAISD